MVVQGHVSHKRLLHIFTTGEPMGFQHIGNAPIEALEHAVGEGRAWFGQAVLNVQGLAQLIKLMVARGLTRATGKQPVGKFLAIVGQNFLHFDWASLAQGVEKRASGSGSGSLVALDLNEHPGRKRAGVTARFRAFAGKFTSLFSFIASTPGIAAQLATDPGLVASKQSGNLRDVVLGIHKAVNLISFNLAEVFITHRVTSTCRSGSLEC